MEETVWCVESNAKASEHYMSDLLLFRVEHGNPPLSKSEADFSPITTIWIQNNYGRLWVFKTFADLEHILDR